MVERFRGAGNKRGKLKLPKTNTSLANASTEKFSGQVPTTFGGLRKFVPSGVSIEQKGSQNVKPHTNNVGCPRTPGHIVTPKTKK